MGALKISPRKSFAIGAIPRQRTTDQTPRASGRVFGPSMANQDFNKRTRELWQPRTSRELTEEDAREMTENVSGFFRLLAEWDLEARREQEPPPTAGHAIEE